MFELRLPAALEVLHATIGRKACRVPEVDICLCKWSMRPQGTVRRKIIPLHFCNGETTKMMTMKAVLYQVQVKLLLRADDTPHSAPESSF